MLIQLMLTFISQNARCQQIDMAGWLRFSWLCWAWFLHLWHIKCCVGCAKIPSFLSLFNTLIMDDSVISTQQPSQNEPASRANNALFSSGTSTSRTVRVNWLKFLFYSWKRISILSKLVVSCNVVLVIAQVYVALKQCVYQSISPRPTYRLQSV